MLHDRRASLSWDRPSRLVIAAVLVAPTRAVVTFASTEPAKHIAQGAKYLQQLRDKDAKLVNESERLFFLQ